MDVCESVAGFARKSTLHPVLPPQMLPVSCGLGCQHHARPDLDILLVCQDVEAPGFEVAQDCVRFKDLHCHLAGPWFLLPVIQS